MDVLDVFSVARSLLVIGATIAEHMPKACAAIHTAAAKVQAATSPADKTRAVLTGLQDAADEARSVLNSIAPQQPPKAP